MKHLPFWITTTQGYKYKTSHGLASCRRSNIIEVYDRHGSQTKITVSSIAKHSAGKI